MIGSPLSLVTVVVVKESMMRDGLLRYISGTKQTVLIRKKEPRQYNTTAHNPSNPKVLRVDLNTKNNALYEKKQDF